MSNEPLSPPPADPEMSTVVAPQTDPPIQQLAPVSAMLWPPTFPSPAVSVPRENPPVSDDEWWDRFWHWLNSRGMPEARDRIEALRTECLRLREDAARCFALLVEFDEACAFLTSADAWSKDMAVENYDDVTGKIREAVDAARADRK